MSDTEKDFASPNFGRTLGGVAATGAIAAAAARTKPGWQRNLMYVFAGITGVVSLIGLGSQISNFGSLPACDAQTTRDTLSDLNKENKFNATKYNFIKSVATSDTEVTCTANLALKGGSNVEYDYRIYKEAGAVRVKITEVRR